MSATDDMIDQIHAQAQQPVSDPAYKPEDFADRNVFQRMTDLSGFTTPPLKPEIQAKEDARLAWVDRPKTAAPASVPGAADMIDRLHAQTQATKAQAAAAPQGGLGNAVNAGVSSFALPFQNLSARVSANATAPEILNGDEDAKLQQKIQGNQQAMQQNFPNDPNRLSGKVGAAAGNLAAIVPASVAAGPLGTAAMMIPRGFENRSETLDASPDMSEGGKLGYLAGGAALDTAASFLTPGGSASNALGKALPNLGSNLLNAGARVGLNAAVAGPEMMGYNTGENALAASTGVDPNRPLTQGNLEAGITGMVQGGLMSGAHEALGSHASKMIDQLHAQATAGTPNAPEAQPVASNPFAEARAKQEAIPPTEPVSGEESFFDKVKRQGTEAAAKLKGLASEEEGSSKVAQAFVKETVKPSIEASKETLSDLARGLRWTVGRQGGEAADATQGALRYAFAERAQRSDQINDSLGKIERQADKLTPAEQIAMTDAVENKQQQPDPKFQDAVDATRDILDDRLSQIQKRDPEFKGLEDYLGHAYKNPEKASAYLANRAKAPLQGGKDFAKHRFFPTNAEARAAGLENQSNNLFTTQKAKLASMDKWITAFDAKEEVKDYLQDVPKNGRVPEGMATVKDPMFRGKMMPQEMASVITNATDPGMMGHPEWGSTLRFIRGVGNTANQASLSLSGHHALATAINTATSEFAEGLQHAAPGVGFQGDFKPVEAVKKFAHATTLLGPVMRDLMKGTAVQKEWLHPGSTGNPEHVLFNEVLKHQGGRAFISHDYMTNSTDKMMRSFRQGNAIAGVARAPLAAAEMLAKPIMEKMVPKLKAAAMFNMYQKVRAENPTVTDPKAVSKLVGKGWDSIDNRFGEMVYDNKFWNQTAKQAAQLGMRSVGWNAGTVAELGGGAKDTVMGAINAVKGERPEMTHRMAYAAALPILTGIWGAGLKYLFTGTPPQQAKDLWQIPTGEKDRDGKEIRINLPAYTNDVANVAHDFPHNIIPTIANKLNPVVSNTSELLHNKDYFGDKVYQEDDSAGNIAKDVGLHALKAAEPLSVSQFTHAKSFGSAAAAFAGVSQSPKWASTSEAEQEAYKPIHEASQASEGRTTQAQTKHDLTSAKRNNAPDADDQIQAALKANQITPKDAMEIRKNAQEPGGLKGAIMSKSLDARYLMKNVFPKMTPEEIGNNQFAMRRKIAGADIPVEEKQKYQQMLAKAIQQ